jgi:hypothetical protein
VPQPEHPRAYDAAPVASCGNRLEDACRTLQRVLVDSRPYASPLASANRRLGARPLTSLGGATNEPLVRATLFRRSEKPQPPLPADDDEARFDDEGSAIGHPEPADTEDANQQGGEGR